MLLLLFINLSFGQQLHRYCFKSSASKNSAQAEFQQFKLAKEDLLGAGSDCFDLMLHKDSRVEFWNEFLAKRHSAEVANTTRFETKTCNIKVTKISSQNDRNSQVGIGRNSSLSKGASNLRSNQEAFIKVLSGKEAGLGFNNETFNFKCKYLNADKYELEFKMEEKQINTFIYTIAGIPMIQRLESDRSKVSSTVILNRGQKLEVAQYKNNEGSNLKSLSLPNGFNRKKLSKSGVMKVYLSIK
jgi:hypothetical protein